VGLVNDSNLNTGVSPKVTRSTQRQRSAGSHLDLGRVLPAAPEQPQAPQQGVCIRTEADGLH
jgi:hypothetical protein